MIGNILCNISRTIVTNSAFRRTFLVYKIYEGINKVSEKRKIMYSYNHENDSYEFRKVLAKKNCMVSLLVTSVTRPAPQANNIIMSKHICKCGN